MKKIVILMLLLIVISLGISLIQLFKLKPIYAKQSIKYKALHVGPLYDTEAILSGDYDSGVKPLQNILDEYAQNGWELCQLSDAILIFKK